MCSASTTTCSPDIKDESCVDHRFTFFEARKSFQNFCRNYSSSKDKPSLSFLEIFDAIITETVDLFQCILQDLRDRERFTGENCQQARVRDFVHHLGGTESYARFGKGGAIPHESAVRLKTLFPKTAVLLRTECLNLFKNNIILPSGFWQREQTIKDTGTEEERFNNRKRMSTYVVRLTANGKIYFVITSHDFKKYVYGWLGAVHDCVVLQSR